MAVNLERKLLKQIEDYGQLQEATPSLVVDVYKKGKRKILLRVGETYDFYDIASLTKIVFTASRALDFFNKQKKLLQEPIYKVLPLWKSRTTTPFRLLTHTAGLDWWKPIYKDLKGPLVPETRWPQLVKKLYRIQPKPRQKALYSDLDLWLLGAYLERKLELSLFEIWTKTYEQLQLKNIFFHRENKPLYERTRYAPTEKCPWRKKILQGEVHDENTWALGGVAPHAGLFADLDSLADWGLKLRAAVIEEQDKYFNPVLARYFVNRRLPVQRGDWGLGFMKPTHGSASCGKFFSATSFGHTGFTGTSLWMDPKQDLLVIILSNRIHPTRENRAFLKWRPLLHDWICEIL